MLLSAQPQPPATLPIIRLLLRSRQPHIYFNCRVFFPQATSHYTDRMIGMLSAPFWKWASVREGTPLGSSTTRSENQAKLQTSGRTKTAVLQCCSECCSAAGAGTITTICYPAQLRAISCTFLPTAVLQKLTYHYTAAQLVDRMETGDACSGLSLCVCPAPDSPHPPLACAVRCCGEMINYPRHATWNKSSVRCHTLLCDVSCVTCHVS